MSVGCRHKPDAVCDECLKAIGTGTAAMYIQTELKPQIGESLDHFQERVKSERAQPGDPEAKSVFVEPTLEQQKEIIKNPAEPEPVRRFYREKLYGQGGTGRKGVMQENLQRRAAALTQNHSIRTMQTIAKQEGAATPQVRPKGMSGRQWKIAKRLLRQLAKTVQQAA